MKIRIFKNTLSILMACCLVLTLASVSMTTTVLAAERTVRTATELTTALGAAVDGDIIKLAANINYTTGITINGKSIIFDLNGFTLNVRNETGTGLEVTNGGNVALAGSGEFDVTGSGFGVSVRDGAKATVTMATAIISNSAIGVWAYGAGSTVTVKGSVTAITASSFGVYAQNGGSITVDGDVRSTSHSAYAQGTGSCIDVNGNATEMGFASYGAYAVDGGRITINGNATGLDSASYGAYAYNGGRITINGNAQGAKYGAKASGKDSSVIVTGNVRGTNANSTGAMADTNGIVTIEGYAQGGSCGAYATDAGSTVKVYGDATSTEDNGMGAYADGSGTIEIRGSATASGGGHSIGAYGLDGKITIGGDATGAYCGAYASGASGEITVGADVDARDTGSYGAKADDGAKVIINGNVHGSLFGVYAIGTGASITVFGDIEATGVYGCGAQSWNGGVITIDGTITTTNFYLAIDSAVKSESEGVSDPDKPGYHKYAEAGTASTIWVKEGSTYSIEDIGAQNLVPLTVGYPSGSQETKTITVNRKGTGDLTNLAAELSGANAGDFAITQPTATTLNAGTPSTTFSVKTKDGLAVGTYTATVTVTADNMTPVTFMVTQTVNAASIVNALISPETETFDKNPANQADVSTTITWNDATSVTDLKKIGISVGAAAYSVSGNTLTIKKEYLITRPTGSLVLTIEFDRGNAATLTITVQDTTLPIGSNPPAWPDGSTLTASDTTKTSTTLNWTAAVDDIGVTGYKIYQDNSLIQTVTGAVYSCKVTGLSSSTHYTFRVQAGDVDNNWTYGPTVTVRTDSSGGGGGSSTSAPAPETKQAAQVLDSHGNISETIPAKLDNSTGTVAVEVNSAALTSAFDKSKADDKGVKTVKVDIPKIDGAKAYEPILSASFLTSGDVEKAVEIKTGIASVKVPGNMLSTANAAGAQNVSLTIAAADKSQLDATVRAQIGRRPTIELILRIDGKQTSWSNESAPVTVAIPYTPTVEELEDPEHIVIWYIDGSGKAVAVPSGRYDSETGTVIYTTTHFSKYAVVYAVKTFDDLGSVAWAKKPIEVLASKDILKGISKKEYAPSTNITRADFLYYLVRTLGVDARVDGNFDDISSDTYYYKEIGIAKKLGITTGTGYNKFSPDESITRQDMIVLTERALRMLKKLKQQGMVSDLEVFVDKSLIAAYAVDSIASVIKEGLIVGSGDKVNPLCNATRAEAAVFLYKIYNKY